MTPDSDSPRDFDLSLYYLHQHDIATAPCKVCPKFVRPIYGYLIILTSSNDVLLYSIKHYDLLYNQLYYLSCILFLVSYYANRLVPDEATLEPS